MTDKTKTGELSETLTPLQRVLADAADLKAAGNVEGAMEVYRQIVEGKGPQPEKGSSSRVVEEGDRKALEVAVYRLAEIYVETTRLGALKTLFVEIRPLFATLPKARTAKIVRNLLDLVGKQETNYDLQEELCEECIEWCRREKRTFLRHRVETRLALLYHNQGKFTQSLNVLTSMLHEVKKLNDNLLLVEIHLIESKLYFSVQHIPKAKAALTASRTHANSIHCPPLLQAEIDLQSGVLHAQEKDHATAYSYFFEAFEAFNIANDPRAVSALKYMMLAKIMCDKASEVSAIASAKNAIAYAGKDIDALKSVAKSHQQRSLKLFDSTLQQYESELKQDQIIQRHISDLHETLLEQNLLRILEPFERVEIEHISKLIELPVSRVQAKLGEMILDRKLQGTLDQGSGIIVVFDRPPLSDLYQDVLDTFKNMSTVVDTLHRKAQQAA